MQLEKLARYKEKNQVEADNEVKEDEMFDNSDIVSSENEESDSDGKGNIAEEKESSKTPSKKQHNKEDSDDIDADPDSNFIKWSFGKERVIPERILTVYFKTSTDTP